MESSLEDLNYTCVTNWYKNIINWMDKGHCVDFR